VRVLKVLLRKEYLQIFRDKFMVAQMLLMPIIQLLLLSSAATFEVAVGPGCGLPSASAS